MKKVIYGTIQMLVSFTLLVLGLYFSKYLKLSEAQWFLLGFCSFVIFMFNAIIGALLIIKGHDEQNNLKY